MEERLPHWWLRIPRPHTWKYQDPLMHSMHLPYLRTKAQCKYREEEFELEFDDYYELWKEKWKYRGRKADDYCMTRINPKKSWNKENVIVVQRGIHLKNSGFNGGK